MKAALAECDRLELVGEASTGAELVQICKRVKPDLVLTDLNMPVLDGAQALRILSFSIPQCVFVVFTGEEDIEKLRHLITAGASDFLRKPLAMDRLTTAVSAIYDREAPRKKAIHTSTVSKPNRGKVISILGSQAGAGATTFAVNLAVTLGHMSGGKAVLLDFDFQSAAATHSLGASGEAGVLEFFQQEREVTRPGASKYLVQRHGIQVLPGVPFPLEAARRNSEVLTSLVEEFAEEFDYVVLDLEPRMDETTQALLGRSQRVYFVTSNDMTNLRAASRFMAVYRQSNPPDEKCRLVYCHCRPDRNIPAEEVSDMVGLQILG